MAGLRDKDLPKQAGFPAGVNNVAATRNMPTNENGTIVAARALVNVDLHDGQPRTRPGRTLVEAGNWHSPGKLIGQGLFAIKDGDLINALTGDMVRAGVGPHRASYVEVNGDLWWTNTEVIRRIRRDSLIDAPIGPACPGAPNAAAYPTGGLAAGTYEVALTWFDDEGHESGAYGSVGVDVLEGQGIRVFDIPQAPESAVLARIYLSAPNGEERYAAKEVAAGVTNTLLTTNDEQGSLRALETMYHDQFPPCSILRYFNGRLFGVTGRNIIVWSPALRPALHHHDDYLRQGADIPMFEPLEGAGIWMADHKCTYWLQGTDPKKDWRRLTKSDKSAVRGSLTVPGSVLGLDTTQTVAFWLASDGVFCAGLPDGTLIRLKEGQLALPRGDDGAILLREHDGIRQLVLSYLSAGKNNMAFVDQASATVTRYTEP